MAKFNVLDADFLSDKSILVTGGTGSFGQRFIKRILVDCPKVRRLIVYSRDELKQYEMSQDSNLAKSDKLRYFLGDVRDKDRLTRAFNDVDIVVHAAALKQVPASEYNPFECVKTNIIGAQNVIEAALDTGVTKVLALSTDKAAAPVNLYGASKLASDKLFVLANNMKGKRDISFSVLRYGNVMGSRGSVIPFFNKLKKTGVLPITDPEMTRFNITLDEGVNFAKLALRFGKGGEIYVPKLPSYNIMDLAKAIDKNCELKIVGRRVGEKLHEEMITVSDSFNTLATKDFFVILPDSDEHLRDYYTEHFAASPVASGFSYNSKDNDHFMTIGDIQSALIRM